MSNMNGSDRAAGIASTGRSRTFACMVALLLLASVGLCSIGCAKTSSDVIRDAVIAEFESYKNPEDETLETIASMVEEEGLSELGISGREFASSVLEGFDYTIDEIRIQGESAYATVTVSSKSASDFNQRVASDVQAFVESDEWRSLSSEEQAHAIGEIALESLDETEVISEAITIEFALDDKTWVSTNASEALSQLDSLAYAYRDRG